MTDKEHKGLVLVESLDTENSIAAVEKKLSEIGEVYRDFGNRLLNNPMQLWKPGQPDRSVSVLQYDVKKLPILVNYQTAFDLADELRVLKARQRELDWEKARLDLY